MPQLYLVAKFDLDDADRFAPIFAKHAADSRRKEGCLFFYLIRDRDNPSEFATMECWDTYADFEAHVADAEHDAFFKQIKPLFRKEPEVLVADLVQGMQERMD
ncbi:MAG: antibiotic biosynthesis monooxygenase [Bacteroidota bacterium]